MNNKSENETNEKVIKIPDVDLLNDEEDVIFNKYAEEYLQCNSDDRLNKIQSELLKTLIYIDKQLREIEEKTEGKAFQRGVYEQKNGLISLRIKILDKLSDLELKEKEKEEEEKDYDNIAELLNN